MSDVRRIFRPRIRTSHVVAGAALVLITTGGASAAGLITGKDIKDGSVSTRDVKNGSLLLKDFKASERSKLVGPAGTNGTNGATGATGAQGTNGTNGAPGASAFTPPPSGTVITGAGLLSGEVSAASVRLRNFSSLPFTPAAPLAMGPTGNLWFGSQSTASLGASSVSAARCPGTAAAPAPTSGNMCVYVSNVNLISPGSGNIFPGVDLNEGASNGFYVYGDSSGAGDMFIRYVWAYKAP